MKPAKTRMFARYIVVDPKICHGKPTFRGTRVLVSDVLEQLAAGMDWDAILDDWNRSISKAAIREALQFASRALLRHAGRLDARPTLGMNILDENIPANQRQQLDSWRVHVYQLGFNISRRGIDDEEILPFLLQQRRSTFFTRDEDFHDRKLRHRRYLPRLL